MRSSLARIDVLIGYVAQALNIGGLLLLLPLVLTHLNQSETALWFIFLSIATFAQLAELGFQPTIARNLAYALAGTLELRRIGLQEIPVSNNPPNSDLVADIIIAAKRLYFYIVSFCAAVLLVIGTAYVYYSARDLFNIKQYIVAWLLFSIGQIANLYFSYFNALLLGSGKVRTVNSLVIISRSSLVVFAAIALTLNSGLLGLGAASLAAAITGRVFAYIFTRKWLLEHRRRRTAETVNKAVAVIWHNAYRLGLVQLGAFFIQRGSIFIVTTFLGLHAAARYGLTATLMITLLTVAGYVAQMHVPMMSYLQAGRKFEQLRTVYGRNLVFANVVFILGFALIALFSKTALSLIGSKTELLDAPMLMLFGLVLLLELNHSVAATYLTTTNAVPFLAAALISGAATFIASVIAVRVFGLWGVIIVQGVVQLSYNNWKWPMLAMRHMGTNLLTVFKLGLKDILKR
jgi:O-antigen/teichoic acid export membrane protein